MNENLFAIKGDICYSKSLTELFTMEQGYLVCKDGRVEGTFKELPKDYDGIDVKDYGKQLMDNFLNATPKFININGVKRIANKSGWGGSAIHDVSIIFDENPYIVVGLSNLGNTLARFSLKPSPSSSLLIVVGIVLLLSLNVK